MAGPDAGDASTEAEDDDASASEEDEDAAVRTPSSHATAVCR